MPTFRLDAPLHRGALAILDGDDAHHLRDVLRVRVGDGLTVCAAGEYWSATVDAIERRWVTARVVAPTLPPWQPVRPVHLYQAVPKARGIEAVIQHASELGAATLTPLITARTIGRREAAGRTDRWQAVAAAAQRQCGRPQPLAIHPVRPLTEALAELAGASVAVPGAPLLALPDGGGPLRVVIGPEGGLSPAEQRLLETHGGHPFGLPAWTLRAATATAAVLAVVNQEVERLAIGY
jgi:16S rRNA (uracil1498-N3)-methyltransferase